MATAKEIIAELASLGYTGPTSYTKTKLEAILAGEKAKLSAKPKLTSSNRKPLLSFLNISKTYDQQLIYEMKHAYAEIDVELKKLEGKTNVSSRVRRAQLEASRAAMQGKLSTLFEKVGNTVAAGKYAAAGAAADYLADAADIFKKAGLTAKEIEVIKDSMRAMAAVNIEHLESRLKLSRIPLSDKVWGTEKLVHDRLDYLINTHIARGTSASELAKAVRQFVDPASPGGVQYAARRLARTELNNAFHATTILIGSESPFIDGFEWKLSGSHPEGDECDDYAAVDVWAAKDVPRKPHPNCLCYLIEKMPSPDEFINRYRTGAYRDWLDERLGPESTAVGGSKWFGAPKPARPTPPKKPEPLGAAAFDEFVEKAKKRYYDHAISVGSAKTDLTKSLNWPTFLRVLRGDHQALSSLMTEKYIDMELFKIGLEAIDKAKTFNPAAAAAYEKAMKTFTAKMAVWEKDIIDWRDANNVTGRNLRGMDIGRRHATDNDGVKWANEKLAPATGVSRTAIMQYTGSDYKKWNGALRQNASKELGDSVPDTLKMKIKQADAGFIPLKEAVVVNRGTYFDEFLFDGYERTSNIPPPSPESLIGTVHVQHGYMSTSVGKTAAFSSSPVQMKILLPEGHNVSWAMPYSEHMSERELLLERSTQYYIHDVYLDRNGKWIVEAEVLPADFDISSIDAVTPLPAVKKFTT